MAHALDALSRGEYARAPLREFLLVACFCFFLYPISVDANSANYAFMLMPLAYALVTTRVHMPSAGLLLCIGAYVLVFAVAAVYQVDFLPELPRRVVSFVLFMSMFSFMFVKLDAAMIRAFKRAIVIVALAFSLASATSFFLLGGTELGFDAKDAVGSQRYGFIYILAFWLLALSRPPGALGHLWKYAAAFAVLVGLVLTFSRASIVGLGASLVAYAAWSFVQAWRVSFVHMVMRVAATAAAAAVALWLLSTFFPLIFEFFDARLFTFLANRDAVEGNLADEETSEGTRIFIWISILEFVAFNPLTGSGYLGVWVLRLFDESSGSAHNQFLDVLFRVGVVGFAIYLALLYRTAALLARHHAALLWGFVGVLVYGMFHETFKESQGGFVLAFLLGMMSQPDASDPSTNNVFSKATEP